MPHRLQATMTNTSTKSKVVGVNWSKIIRIINNNQSALIKAHEISELLFNQKYLQSRDDGQVIINPNFEYEFDELRKNIKIGDEHAFKKAFKSKAHEVALFFKDNLKSTATAFTERNNEEAEYYNYLDRDVMAINLLLDGKESSGLKYKQNLYSFDQNYHKNSEQCTALLKSPEYQQFQSQLNSIINETSVSQEFENRDKAIVNPEKYITDTLKPLIQSNIESNKGTKLLIAIKIAEFIQDLQDYLIEQNISDKNFNSDYKTQIFKEVKLNPVFCDLEENSMEYNNIHKQLQATIDNINRLINRQFISELKEEINTFYATCKINSESIKSNPLLDSSVLTIKELTKLFYLKVFSQYPTIDTYLQVEDGQNLSPDKIAANIIKQIQGQQEDDIDQTQPRCIKNLSTIQHAQQNMIDEHNNPQLDDQRSDSQLDDKNFETYQQHSHQENLDNIIYRWVESLIKSISMLKDLISNSLRFFDVDVNKHNTSHHIHDHNYDSQNDTYKYEVHGVNDNLE